MRHVKVPRHRLQHHPEVLQNHPQIRPVLGHDHRLDHLAERARKPRTPLLPCRHNSPINGMPLLAQLANLHEAIVLQRKQQKAQCDRQKVLLKLVTPAGTFVDLFAQQRRHRAVDLRHDPPIVRIAQKFRVQIGQVLNGFLQQVPVAAGCARVAAQVEPVGQDCAGCLWWKGQLCV
uniref:(northern house mosquito) hypothetical protein n=1 Tax=Culex pipiens TaxID=7175 RepID=A0A8D8FNQ1_CULPI